MELDDTLSAKVLGRFSVMQSMVAMLPNENSMLDFVCQGMRDVGGVKNVTYRLLDKENARQKDRNEHLGESTRTLSVKHKNIHFGELCFELSNVETFNLYLPFISNFVTMLGVIFDQLQQRRLNEALMSDLERRVEERTSELQERESDLRVTLNSIGDAVISTDLQCRIIRMNPIAEKLTGWNAYDAQGKLLTEVFTVFNTEAQVQNPNPFQVVLLTGQTNSISSNTVLVARDGTQYRIDDSIAPIKSDGTIRGIVLVFRDVTTSFRAAEALKQKSEELDSFFELTPDLLCIARLDGLFIRVNKAWSRALGYSVEELYERPFLSFVHPDDLSPTHEAMSLLQNFNEVKNFVNRYRHKDNSYRWIEWHSTLVGDKIFAAARDITERKFGEEILWKSKERFRLLFEMSAAGAAELDSKTGRFVMVNRGLCSLLGYSQEEMLSLDFFEITHPDDKASEQEYMRRILCGEIREFNMEKRFLHKDGRVVWVIVTVAPLWRPNELPSNHIAIIQDITKRKEAELELKSSLQEKEILLQELYHRTRNNMQVISSILDMQAATVEDARTLGILEDAQNRIRAMSLVHQKLYESKNLSRVNMNEYLNDLVDIIQSSFTVPESQVVINIEAEDVWMLIDLAVPCGLVLNELLTNCFKYAFPNNRSGHIDLRLHYLEPTLLELVVSDNGAGPPHGFDSRRSGGLGMMLVHQIVEKQLKGSVSLQTSHGMYWNIRFPTNRYEERV